MQAYVHEIGYLDTESTLERITLVSELQLYNVVRGHLLYHRKLAHPGKAVPAQVSGTKPGPDHRDTSAHCRPLVLR